MKTILTAQFELQNSWFLNAIEEITDHESNIALTGMNPIKWLAGHLLNTRMVVLQAITGTGVDPELYKLFGKGSSGKVDSSSPTIEELIGRWNTVAVELSKTLNELSEERLQSAPPFQTSIPDTTLQGFIAYMSAHETFHIGQISIIRKMMGKESMKMGARK